MTGGDYFVLCMMAMNGGAAIYYLVDGYSIMAWYWGAAFQLNTCLLLMRLYGGE